MTDEKPKGAVVVAEHLGDIKKAIADLNGSSLPFMEKLMAHAEKNAATVEAHVNKGAEMGLDPWVMFWVEKPTMGQFKVKVSVIHTPEEIWKQLVAAGWIEERVFNRKKWYRPAVGTVEGTT